MNAPVASGVTAQRRASNPKISAWVDASAGTGKTRVLTDRVLRLLLDGAAPDRILCITFTRAAAAEMANRIVARLGGWAVMPDSDLEAALFDLTGERPSSGMQTRARQLFAAIVDAQGGLRIQTIHAFCQSVLRRFPLEANVAPHFDLLDDRTGSELLAEARQSVLIEAARQPASPLGRALAQLVAYMDERGFADLMQAVVVERRKLTQAIESHGGAGLLIPRMWRTLGLEPGQDKAAILADACREGAFDRPALKAACDALSAATATDQKRAAGILDWLGSADRVSGWDDYVTQFLTGKGEPRKATTKAHKSVLHLLEPETERLLAVADSLCAAATAQATEAMLVVASALFANYAAEKSARALLDYDDLIDITRRLVENDASWVLYKLDGGIEHLLLDEAQDTNPDQWGIIKALAAEFFAGKGAREQNRTIFVVGDGKQSIYSFQGADPTALKPMRLHFESRLTAIGQQLEAVDLSRSYRSTEPVLTVVDAVFAHPAAYDGVHDNSHPLKHAVHRTGHAGLVELWPVFAPPDDAEETQENWALPETADAAGDPETELAERIAATIAGWLAAGEMLASENRPIHAGDVMILVRRRTRFVAPLVRALKARGVPVAGVDRLALTEPLAVQDLMALGRFLLLPEDDLTLAALLKSPLIGIDEGRLFDLAHGRTGTLWNALLAAAETDAKAFEPARAFLSGLLAEVDFIRPFELFACVLAAPCPGAASGSGRQALWGRLGPDALDPLDEFLSAALDYERRHAPTLEGFIGWLEASDAEIKRELAHGEKSVRIVTVHGAKGLEAPIVFMPDTTQPPAAWNGPQLLWHEDGRSEHGIPFWSPRAELRPAACHRLGENIKLATQREYRRLLYVALTRARDRLYVAGWHGKRKPGEGNWYGLVEEGMRASGALELEDGLLRLDYVGTAAAAARQAEPPGVTSPLPGWAVNAAPAEPRPFRPLTPSRMEPPDALAPPVRSPATPEDSRRFRRGRAMHRLLQILPDLTPGERPGVADRLLPDFTESEREAMLIEALGVIDDPACVHFFGPGSRAEVPVVGRIGLRGISGQIDRLLVQPDRITIVDFKSGRIPASGAGSVPSAYLAQMAAYRAVLRQIYPGRDIDLVLIWTDGPVAVTLAAEQLDPFESYLTSAPAA